jgi:hypothetical protein
MDRIQLFFFKQSFSSRHIFDQCMKSALLLLLLLLLLLHNPMERVFEIMVSYFSYKNNKNNIAKPLRMHYPHITKFKLRKASRCQLLPLDLLH